jgi:hypothetical protein
MAVPLFRQLCRTIAVLIAAVQSPICHAQSVIPYDNTSTIDFECECCTQTEDGDILFEPIGNRNLRVIIGDPSGSMSESYRLRIGTAISVVSPTGFVSKFCLDVPPGRYLTKLEHVGGIGDFDYRLQIAGGPTVSGLQIDDSGGILGDHNDVDFAADVAREIFGLP